MAIPIFNMKLKNITLILEQESNVNTIRRAILERLPMTITYQGPEGEVASGTRYNVIPVVLGQKKDSNNYVIWAYTTSGVSKKGNLPDWRMFRVDRIVNAQIESNTEPVDLKSVPGFIKKMPSDMKSLSRVLVYSDLVANAYKEKFGIWKADRLAAGKNVIAGQGTRRKMKTDIKKDIDTTLKTDFDDKYQEVITNTPNDKHKYDAYTNNIIPKIKDINGIKTITTDDFNTAVSDLYYKKEGDWKNYQREISKTTELGLGNKRMFTKQAQGELQDLLKQNNVTISDQQPDQSETNQPEEASNNEMLAEIYKRFKRLIK